MRLLIHTVIFSLVFVFNLAQASGAALAIITEPSDAEIYVNSELKTNTTPIVLKLSAGTYQIQIKRAGKETQEFPIMLTDESVVIKRVSLVEAKPVVIDLKAMLSPVRDSFETEEEFAARRQLIIKQFNDAVAKHDLSYRAGIAKLKKEGYDIKAQTFPLEITWDAWATQFKMATSGQLTIPRDQARSLWNEGAEKPVFLLFDLQTRTPKIIVLWGSQTQWYVYATQRQNFEPAMVATPTAGKLISRRYRDNGDGTVTDVTTKLMWKRCSEGQVWDGGTCVGSASQMTWDEAMQKRWPSFARYKDWRVPTIEELRTIVVKGVQPTIDNTAFPNTKSEWFWSASTVASSPPNAWAIYFYIGQGHFPNRSYAYLVRLVRVGQ